MQTNQQTIDTQSEPLTALRQANDNTFYAREFNKEIRQGRRFYVISPLNGSYASVTRFRTVKGCLQAKSERTGKWLGCTFETVRRSS